MTLRVYDTLTGEKRPFETLEPGRVRMYVCGITPYDRCHMGHARSALTYDIVYRYLRFAGFKVEYVRNFTDVDDKIIKRSNERGLEATALAQENIDAFYEDMDALKVARPEQEPRVSTSMPQIIALVEQLIARGVAYPSEGDVYYAVEKFPEYGKLGKRSLDDMVAGARVEVSARKRHPMDFALWKAAKPGEPSWESPWGPGRPGWHIECSAMGMHAHGPSMDLHGGGQDLIFPHHENEIAQSEGATGAPYVRHWVHNGFVNVDDEKMSKSLGNFFTIADVRGRYSPQSLRLFVLSTHYRNPINFSDAALDECAARIAYFYETLRKLEVFLDQRTDPVVGPLPGEAFLREAEAQFVEAMDDDFNTVRVLGVLAEAFKLLNEYLNTRKAKALPAAVVAARTLRDTVMRMDTVLQLFTEDPAAYLEAHRHLAALRRGLDLDWVSTTISDRLVARGDKDFLEADRLRDVLLAAGVVLMDGPHGTDWSVQDTREPPATPT